MLGRHGARLRDSSRAPLLPAHPDRRLLWRRVRSFLSHSRMPSRRSVGIWIGRLLLIAVLLGTWETLARTGLINTFFVSSPSRVYHAEATLLASAMFIPALKSTLEAVVVGFALGAGAGVMVGLLIARLPLVGSLVDPILAALNSVPRVALAPLFILWFGIRLEGKSFLAASLVGFIVLATTRAGAKHADSDLLMMSRVMGATKNQTFRKIIVPVSIPSIFSGLRLGSVYALLGVIVSEMVAAQQGLGVILTQYSNTFNISATFAVLVVLAAIAMILDNALINMERYLLRWRDDNTVRF